MISNIFLSKNSDILPMLEIAQCHHPRSSPRSRAFGTSEGASRVRPVRSRSAELGGVPIQTEDRFSFFVSVLFDQLLKGLAILVLCMDQSVPLMAIALTRKFGFHLILFSGFEISPHQEIPKS